MIQSFLSTKGGRLPNSMKRGCGRPKEDYGRVAKACVDCGFKATASEIELICPNCGGPLARGGHHAPETHS